MPTYRLYFLNQSGRIERAEQFDAEDDVRAVRAVADRAGDAPTELWLEGRKVSRPRIAPTL
ncbi:MAG TPA: hypothetical protein VIT38_00750 [Allosphingosinicella sp.]